MIKMPAQREEANKRSKEENGSLRVPTKVPAVRKTFLCPECGQGRTYFRIKTSERVCRNCGNVVKVIEDGKENKH